MKMWQMHWHLVRLVSKLTSGSSDTQTSCSAAQMEAHDAKGLMSSAWKAMYALLAFLAVGRDGM